MSETPRFQPKPPELLRQQVEKTTQKIGEELIPPFSKEDVFSLPLNKIKERFPRRYEMYTQLLRADKNKRDIPPEKQEKMRNWLHILNSLDLYIEVHKSDAVQRTLYEKQFTVFEDVRNFLEQGGNEGYVKLPTGFGKTVIFSEFIEAVGVKTLVLVPKQMLVEQTVEKFSQFGENLDVGRVYQDAKEHGRQVTVTTYQSLLAGLKTGKVNPNEYQCVILDEAHKALGEKTSEALQKVNGVLKIGFTATPDYAEDKRLSQLLEHEIHKVTIREAVEWGMLSPLSAIVARTETDLSNVRVEGGRFNKEQLEKAVNISARNQAAIELYRQMFDGHQAVAYCSGIEHARDIAELFQQNDVSAALISGKQTITEKQNLKNRFASGDLQALCNADVLIEGFDEPRASVCLNLRPTLSHVVAEQRGGRVLRKDKNNPDKHAYIVDFLDKNTPPETVTFAEVAEGADIREPAALSVGPKSEPQPPHHPVQLPNIKGLKVIVHPEEVMRIVQSMKETREQKEKTELLSFEALQQEIQRAGIKNSKEYRRQFKSHPGWPSNPNNYYSNQWIDWGTFLGKHIRKEKKSAFLSLDKLQEEVRRVGIKNNTEYTQQYKNHPGWPSNPKTRKSYDGQWPDGGWDEFLGKFMSYEKLQQEILSYGIKGSGEYAKQRKIHPGWPASPNKLKAYNNQWQGWDSFFGRENRAPFLSFDKLQEEVRAAGIRGAKDYVAQRKIHPGWPSNPNKIYKDTWEGWNVFFGKKK